MQDYATVDGIQRLQCRLSAGHAQRHRFGPLQSKVAPEPLIDRRVSQSPRSLKLQYFDRTIMRGFWIDVPTDALDPAISLDRAWEYYLKPALAHLRDRVS